MHLLRMQGHGQTDPQWDFAYLISALCKTCTENNVGKGNLCYVGSWPKPQCERLHPGVDYMQNGECILPRLG
jgi:hypothetical protein